MSISKIEAEKIFREQMVIASNGAPDKKWVQKIQDFSVLCEQSNVKTHIAFLGTSLLAKSLDLNVDLYAIKPSHYKKNENAYSARSLCHSVLVPLSAELGIDLGVSGREPLRLPRNFDRSTLESSRVS